MSLSDEQEVIDKAIKREQLERINVQQVTNRVLKECGVVREKNYSTKPLFSRTGVACGARAGSS